MLFAGLLLLQVGIPIVQLGKQRPARYGWHMFAGSRAQPEFWAQGRDGALTRIDLGRFLGNPRGDLEITAQVWTQLCAIVPAAAAIRTRGLDQRVEEHRCP